MLTAAGGGDTPEAVADTLASIVEFHRRHTVIHSQSHIHARKLMAPKAHTRVRPDLLRFLLLGRSCTWEFFCCPPTEATIIDAGAE